MQEKIKLIVIRFQVTLSTGQVNGSIRFKIFYWAVSNSWYAQGVYKDPKWYNHIRTFILQ